MNKEELATLAATLLNIVSEHNTLLSDVLTQSQKNEISKAVELLPQIMQQDFYDNRHFTKLALIKGK